MQRRKATHLLLQRSDLAGAATQQTLQLASARTFLLQLRSNLIALGSSRRRNTTTTAAATAAAAAPARAASLRLWAVRHRQRRQALGQRTDGRRGGRVRCQSVREEAAVATTAARALLLCAGRRAPAAELLLLLLLLLLGTRGSHCRRCRCTMLRRLALLTLLLLLLS